MCQILLVEDHDDTRQTFASLLRTWGHDVFAVRSVASGIAFLEVHKVDVILSDLGLPDMPGDVLIRQIVAGARRRARVIVVTGYGEPYLTRARQAGADVVFTKPVEWAQVLEAIDKPDLAASA